MSAGLKEGALCSANWNDAETKDTGLVVQSKRPNNNSCGSMGVFDEPISVKVEKVKRKVVKIIFVILFSSKPCVAVPRMTRKRSCTQSWKPVTKTTSLRTFAK